MTIGNSKLIGGILLIVGTSIGGGMLALPVSNAGAGFADSTVFLILCWLAMTMGALLILEVNMWLPSGSNLISMAGKTLGMPGKIVAWLSYLLLLYTLLSAYISGGSDVLQGLLQTLSISIPQWLSAIIFVTFFGTIVITGIKSVDYVNRGLMFGKLGVYLLLVLLIQPHITLHNLGSGNIKYVTGTLMVLITAFGFATIVPSLRSYFHDDVTKLRKVIIIGSLIPLICYIIWDMVIMGVVPRTGDTGLMQLMHSNHANTDLTLSLMDVTHSNSITEFFRFFTSICMLTAFLGVSLCLFDFLADGLKLAKQGRSRIIITALTFIPPLAIVLFYPGAFIMALSYAGVFCVILLLVMPALMAWSGRYIKKLATEDGYQVLGGKVTLALVSLMSLVLLGVAIMQVHV